MKTCVAVVLLLSITGSAAAEGERSPMFGAALTYTDAPDREAELVGGEFELAWWWWRLGIAIEGAARRGITDDSLRNLAVAGSARVLLASWLSPSLFEPRDVELGVELQAIAARTWWDRDDSADAFGLGLAIRMRGGSDWMMSSLLAESRLFVRVMRSYDELDMAVRASPAGAMSASERDGVAVMVGLGAAFGVGERRYLERFRPRAFDSAF